MLPFELTKDTPYLALSGELWSVFYEYLNRNWSCYKGFLLYMRINTNLNHKEMEIYGCIINTVDAAALVLKLYPQCWALYY